ncbi:MAG: GNAT family N-acetyltransferase [Candidatus Gastranaerophilaceae bacterium]
MNIRGNNIVLRAVTLKDAKLLMELINDPETEEMLGGSSFPVSLEEQEKWIVSQQGRKDILRCIVTRLDDEIGVGTVILTDIDRKNGVAQVHIKMGKDEGRGRGYGKDALNTIVNYAFDEMRLNCIYANVIEYNDLSRNLFEKCGFKKEGILRSRVYKNGRYNDIVSYSKIKEV